VWSAGNSRRRAGITDVYVSDGEVVVVDGTGVLWRHGAGATSGGLEALAGHLREGSATRVRVWLGATLCRPVRIAPIAGEMSRKERARLAEMAAVEHGGLAPPCRVSLDAPDATGEVVAIVVEEAVLAEIHHMLDAARRRAISIQPWWAHVLANALRAKPGLRALGVSEGDVTTVLVGQGRRFSSAHALRPVADAAAASAVFARTLISAMIPEDASLMVRLDWSAAAADVSGTRALALRDVAFGPWTVQQGASS
jgi:hypothetical protein